MQKNSNSDYEGQPTQLVSMQIGEKGLDLRDTTDIKSLTVLNNARFLDETSVERRTGHDARVLQDSSQYPVGQTATSNTWVYGHGNLCTSTFASSHHPIVTQNKATFNYEGSQVSWTGDRLLVSTNGATCFGNSTYWNNRGSINSLPFDAVLNGNLQNLSHGIPCYLPSLVDFTPVITVPNISGTSNNSTDIALSTTNRVIVYNSLGNSYAQVYDRTNNQIISFRKLNNVTTNNTDCRVVFSNKLFVVYWRDGTTNILYSARWNGTSWSNESNIVTTDTYELTSAEGDGYHLIYRLGAVIKARFYMGTALQVSPYLVDTIVDTTGTVPSGPIAIAVNPVGELGVAWYSTTGYMGREYTSRLVIKAGYPVVTLQSYTDTPACVTIVSSALADFSGNYIWTVYGSYVGAVTAVAIVAFQKTAIDGAGTFKSNCHLISKAFVVGTENFAWLQSTNSSLHFLISGVLHTRVCGFADRGEAATPKSATIIRTLTGVANDPLNAYKFTWARPIKINSTTQTNHIRYSDIDFLPAITTTQYGKSVYLSGSAVQNFDGYDCSDAGFQDYPIVVSGVASAGGSLSAGNYQIRAYAVRYNNKGEKFTSAALTSPVVTAAGGQKITWTILPLQACTAEDVVIEIYRTQANGTTFTLEATVANDKTVSPTFSVSTLSDISIAILPGDVFQPQLGGLAETPNFGPVGCTTLVTYSDRLWSCGGQVPTGKLQFSKLKVEGFGAGFDALAGQVTVDSEGSSINSICGMNDTMVALASNKVFIIEDRGPDNFNRGNFPSAKFAAAKGASTHFGTILTDVGLVYWNEGGPHLLNGQFTVSNISDSIRPLAITLQPTGCKLNPQRQEVIWYTNTGTALLWDYKANSRWATWSGLYVNGASPTGLATVDGKLLTVNNNIYTDGGQAYVFSIKTAPLRAEQLLSGYTLLKRYGITGSYVGEHTLEFRVYYNNSPLWEEDEVWYPTTETYLSSIGKLEIKALEDLGGATAADIDGLIIQDKSGNYGTHRRAKRQNCQSFQVELLDNGPFGPSYIPQTLEFELGQRPGYGRTPVNTFTDR